MERFSKALLCFKENDHPFSFLIFSERGFLEDSSLVRRTDYIFKRVHGEVHLLAVDDQRRGKP
jgi:hypothetical protein